MAIFTQMIQNRDGGDQSITDDAFDSINKVIQQKWEKVDVKG